MLSRLEFLEEAQMKSVNQINEFEEENRALKKKLDAALQVPPPPPLRPRASKSSAVGGGLAAPLGGGRSLGLCSPVLPRSPLPGSLRWTAPEL